MNEPYHSSIHRVSPKLKLIVLVMFSIGLCFITNLWVLSISLGVIWMLYFIAKITLKKLFMPLRPIAIIACIIFLVQVGTNNWLSGLAVVFRLSILLLFSSLITLTTSTSELLDGLNSLLRVLSYVGVNPKKISLSLSLAIRFIPLMVSIFEEIRIAQRSRGLEDSFISTIIPTIIKMLKTAEDIAEAIESRGW
ncbi:MAG: energy-coupling factor transporter transmembrane protein EcfT [Amoebophilaceae bacterium]|nr:energy-coupling factor transporter transmembrane protein EcfT [Amoebophilaceae bacterium]